MDNLTFVQVTDSLAYLSEHLLDVFLVKFLLIDLFLETTVIGIFHHEGCLSLGGFSLMVQQPNNVGVVEFAMNGNFVQYASVEHLLIDSKWYRLDGHITITLNIHSEFDAPSAPLSKAHMTIELILQQAIHDSRIKSIIGCGAGAAHFKCSP